MPFFVYMLKCANDAYYTGWTTDPQRRLKQHNGGQGARYTRLNGPSQIVYLEEHPDRVSAQKRELEIKKLDHAHKQRLIDTKIQSNDNQRDVESYQTILAPGRVNLLGEHVDYNGGVVLPVAIDRYLKLQFREIDKPILRLNAIDLHQQLDISLDRLEEKIDTEGNALPAFAYYPAGVAWALKQAGLLVTGMDANYSSTIPIGSGLSSSAAVQVAFATAWQALGNWQIDRMQLALICKKSENQYIGVQSGLMDQFASIFGMTDYALCLDTRSLEWKPIRLPEHTTIIIADSQVRRSLAGSAYNERRKDCEESLKKLQELLPDIKDLRDVSVDQFQKLANYLPERQKKRARFVVEECARVTKAVDALEGKDARTFGSLMIECHQGLRDLYEVSCPELDILVETAIHLPGCLGARLTGAGFGGCTVNLVEEAQTESFINQLTEQYLQKTGKAASIYLCHASNGAEISDR